MIPASLLRIGAGMLPMKALHHMQWISDSVFAMSKRLLNQKMKNLRKGDEVLIHDVGEGKDLMSVLRKW